MNAVERSVVLASSDVLDVDAIELIMEGGKNKSGSSEADEPAKNLSLEAIEKRSILDALDACGGNKSETARRLGITRKTLCTKLDKYRDADH